MPFNFCLLYCLFESHKYKAISFSCITVHSNFFQWPFLWHNRFFQPQRNPVLCFFFTHLSLVTNCTAAHSQQLFHRWNTDLVIALELHFPCTSHICIWKLYWSSYLQFYIEVRKDPYLDGGFLLILLTYAFPRWTTL